MTAKWLIRVVAGDDIGAHAVVEKNLVVGRDPASCSLVLNDVHVGRRHASFGVNGDGRLEVHPIGDHVVGVDGRDVTGPLVVPSGGRLRFGRTRVRVLRVETLLDGAGSTKVTVRVPGDAPVSHVVTGVTVVGRDPSRVGIVVADRAVSSEHCVLLPIDSGLSVEDRSRYGTTINGRLIDGCAVAGVGDVLGIGDSLITVDATPSGTVNRPPVLIDVGVEGTESTRSVQIDARPHATVGEVVAALVQWFALSPGPWGLYRPTDGLCPSAPSAWGAVPVCRADLWLLAAWSTAPADGPASIEPMVGYTTAVTRPPRDRIGLDAHSVDLPPMPDDTSARARGVPWQAAGSIASLAVAIVMGIVFPQYRLFALLAGTAGSGAFAAGLLAERARRRHAMQQFDDRVAELDGELGDVVARQAETLRRAAPATATALDTVLADPGALWSRRPHDGDFLSTRVAVGSMPARLEVRHADRWRSPALGRRLDEILAARSTLHGVPLCTPGQRGVLVAIVGPADLVTDVGRALLLQVVTQHAPSEVRVTVLTTSDRWRWTRWLPHVSSRAGLFAAWSARHLDAVAGRIETATARADDGVDDSPRWWALVAPGTGGRPAVRNAVTQLRRAGAVIVMLADTSSELPADPHWLLDLTGDRPVVRDPSGRFEVTDVEGVDVERAETVGRWLGHFVDNEAENLGASVEVDAVSLWGFESAEALSVTDHWDAAPPGLRPVVIGVTDDGEPVAIGFREGDPHGMVAGTSGSGKSELLKTLIAGLVVEHPPEQLALFLIDFKGGSTFREFAELPHVVGLVTDIETDRDLAVRAFQALDAEVARRKTIIDRARVNDIVDYERLPEARANPLPNLLVVIDEFALLVQQQRELISSLDTVAMQGRSLGVHLLLAAQDPSGVITNAIRVNTGLWLCLRVVHGGQSLEMLGSDLAARIPSDARGRAYIRRGAADSPAGFQTARIARPIEASGRPAVEIRPFGDDMASAPAAADPASRQGRVVTELDVVVRRVQTEAAGRGGWRPSALWLPPLPDRVAAGSVAWPARPADRPAALIGLLDQPDVPCQIPFGVDLSAVGHMVVLGRLGSGRTTTLMQTALDLAAHQAPNAVHLYGIDAGDGALSSLERLPQCGGVIAAGDTERLTRLLRRLSRVIDERRRDVTADGGGDFARWRATTPSAPPWIVVVIDDIGILREMFDRHPDQSLGDLFTAVVQGGAAVGVHAVFGASQAADLRAQLLNLCGARVVLSASDPSDIGQLLPLLRWRNDRGGPPGRGYASGSPPSVVQVIDPGDSALWQWQPGTGGPSPVRRFPRPDEFMLDDLPTDPGAPDGVFIAVGGDEIEPIAVDFGRDPHLLVLGESGVGRSTAVTAVVLRLLGADPRRRAVILAPRGGPLARLAELLPERQVVVALTDDEISAAVRTLVPTMNDPVLLAIDDAETLPRDVGEALSTLLREARRTGLRSVTSGRAADMVRQFDDWARYLLSLRNAVLLNPLPDLELQFDLRPSRHRPPAVVGRGLLVARGFATEVQMPAVVRYAR